MTSTQFVRHTERSSEILKLAVVASIASTDEIPSLASVISTKAIIGELLRAFGRARRSGIQKAL